MVLVDTSVWILTFRRSDPLDVTALVPFDDIATCLPIVQEVLQGFRSERAFRTARDAMLALPRVADPLSQDLTLEAVDLYRRARRQGITVRSSTDCMIAAAALAWDLLVLHHDRDFEQLARISALRQRGV